MKIYTKHAAITKSFNIFLLLKRETIKLIINILVPALVCPDGNDRVVCKSTPSTIGKSIPKSDNITDGRGARIIRFIGVVIRVATSWPASITTDILHFLNNKNIPATAQGTQPPICVKYLKKVSSTEV